MIFHKCTVGDVSRAFMSWATGLATWHRNGEGRDTIKAVLEAAA